MEHRCVAVKQDKKRCTRTATCVRTRMCTQHAKLQSAPPVEREPWTALGMLAPSAKNSARALRKLRSKLRRRPPKNDKEDGYIYVYGIRGERVLNYWKVGMTERADVEKRVGEWRRTHGKGAVELRDHFRTRHPKHVERVIHLFLAYCRMYRYQLSDGSFHSVWAESGDVIKDGQEQEAVDGERLVAKHKHIEWFCEEYAHIRSVIESVVAAYEKMNDGGPR
jgi:T5orf172 domain